MQRFYTAVDPGTNEGELNGRFVGNNNMLAADSLGNTYLVTNIGDVRVTKIDSQGNVVYVRQFGGSDADGGSAITADAAGNVWVAGNTRSADFPTTLPNLAPGPQGPSIPMFVTKLDSKGNIVYSVIDPYWLSPLAIAVDQTGAAYLTGVALNAFPFTTPGAYESPTSNAQAFVMKLSPGGDRLVYATALGGSKPICTEEGDCPEPNIPGFFGFSPIEIQEGNAIAVDVSGNAYIGGITDDVDFPTTAGAFQTKCNCHITAGNGFVSKISADGSTLLYSTYLGETPGASVQAIAINAAGEAWVAGPTLAPFPTTAGAAFPSPASNASASPGFLAKVNASGSTLEFATYLTASGDAGSVLGLALHGDGSVLVSSLSSPTQGFTEQFDATASNVEFSAMLAKGQADLGFAPAPNNGFAVAGSAGLVSGFQPSSSTAPSVFALTDSATLTACAPVAPGELITLFGANLGPAVGVAAAAVGGFIPTQLGGAQVLFDGVPAPLLYVSASQVNAVVPYEVFGRNNTTVQIMAAGGSASYTYSVVASDPRVFEAASGGSLVFNQDASQNSAANPAASGSIVTVFASGAGMMVNPEGITGQIVRELNQPELPVSVLYQPTGLPTENPIIVYAGAAPTLVSGMLQVNFVLPLDARTGDQFALQVGEVLSEPVTLFVH